MMAKSLLRKPVTHTITHVLIGTMLRISGMEWMVVAYVDTKPGIYTLRSTHSGEEHFTSSAEMATALASGLVEVLPPEWALKKGMGV